MKCISVRFTIKKSIGQYESEELECVLEPDVEAAKPETPEELLARARAVCVQQTTAYLTKVRRGES